MSSGDTGVTELSSLMARVQGILVSRDAAAQAVRQLAEVARDMVQSAVGAGASLFDADGTPISTGTTDRVAEMADDLKYRLGSGPCITGWATSALQRVDDTETDLRWAAWSTAVRELGVRSVLSAPLVFRSDTIGALKIYSTVPAAFTTADEQRLVLLTTAAATLLGMAQGSDGPQKVSAGLAQVIADRQTIDLATGVLMERHQILQDAARYRLLERSRTQNMPLVTVARQVLSEPAEPVS